MKSIFSILDRSSKKLGEAQLIEKTRNRLLNDLEKGGLGRIVDSGDNGLSKSVMNCHFISSLKNMLEELDNTSLRALVIFIKGRFARHSDYETFKDELSPLAEFSKYLEKYLKDSDESLSTMMINMLSDVVSKVVSKADEMGLLE